MDKQSIIDYIDNNGGAEIPSLQLKFKLSYRQARDIVDELIETKRLKYSEGIWFASTVIKPDFKCLAADVHLDEASNGDDRSSQMEKFVRELREKRMSQLMRTIAGDPDPEVEDWLAKAFAADKSLTLKQALKQAQSELSRAQKSNSVIAAVSYGKVTNYLINCNEETFERIKKRLTKK